MNLRLARPKTEEDNGYFRIGNVVLSIPPEGISTNKIIANEEHRPLRAKNSMFVKTGHSRLDATVTWKALADPDSGDWQDWEDIQKIIAMFRAAPFQEVENKYLRQVVLDQLAAAKDSFRMAFATRQLKIDTLPDIVHGLQVTLTMSLFNYAPYSEDFSYVGPDKTKVTAGQSSLFAEFIDQWIRANLGEGWKDTEPGSFNLAWRQYQLLPINSYPSLDKQKSAEPTIPAPKDNSQPKPKEPVKVQEPPNQPASGRLRPSDRLRQKIERAARAAGVDPALAVSIAQHESNLSQTVVKPSGTVLGQKQRVGDVLYSTDKAVSKTYLDRINPNTGKKYTEAEALAVAQAYPVYKRAVGLFQILPSTGANLGYSPDSLATEDGNIACAMDILKYLAKRHKGNTHDMLVEYSEGPSSFKTGHLKFPTQTGKYLTEMAQLLSANGASHTVDVKVPDQGVSVDIQQSGQAGTSDRITQTKQVKLPGYVYDYVTEKGIFAYKVNELKLETYDGVNYSSPGLYANQISVLMVNNLAQLPLSAYQYQTYQHIGPPVTMVNVGLVSLGDRQADDEEPTHVTLNTLVTSISDLEQQFIRLRPEWRSVASIHRMQSLFVENQILQLCGIRAMLVSSCNTQTSQESPDLVEGELTGYQYENIFEQLQPFQVKNMRDQLELLKKAILTNDEKVGVLAGGRESKYKALASIARAKENLDTSILTKAMQDPGFYEHYDVPMPVDLTPEENQTIRNLLEWDKVKENSSIISKWTGSEAALIDQWFSENLAFTHHVSKKSAIPFSDYWRLKQIFPDQMKDAAASIDARIAAGMAANASMDPLNLFYDQVIAYELNKPTSQLSRELNDYVQNPEYKNQLSEIAKNVGLQTPAVYNGRAAYSDLGLSLGDGDGSYSPTYYLWDYHKEKKSELASKSAEIANVAEKVHSSFNNVIAGSGVQTLRLNAKHLVSSTIVPSMDMARAFPTFKLLLIEEDNNGPFYCYDDFYSWASVLSMEIIRYKDKPDTAVLQITNLSNLLGQRLYDNTIAGRRENERDWSATDIPNSSDGSAVTAGPGVLGKKRVQETPGGYNRQIGDIPDLSKYAKRSDGAELDLPLQYFALQPGSKIQVRMGFSNNPDELYPVFHGMVAEVEGDEILTVVAQGFQVELMNPVLTLNTNRGGLSRGWLDSGDAVAVMKSAIGVETAKHFGRWQVDPDNKQQRFIMDWKWKAAELLADAAAAAGSETASAISDAMTRVTNRAYENISITRKEAISSTETEDQITQAQQVQAEEKESGQPWTRSAIPPDTTISATWTKVFDGDTVEVRLDDGRITRVRMDYMDAPESDQGQIGLLAKQNLETYLNKAANRQIKLHVRRSDLYGRALAQIFIGSWDINGQMVQYGFAETYTEGGLEGSNPYQPLQDAARAKNLGIWSYGYLPGDADKFRSNKQKAQAGNFDLTVTHRKNLIRDSTLLDPRPKDYENSWGGWVTPPYAPPTDMDRCTPWNVIRDVARRFPEQILAVKNYGYPYQCEATLVFARPESFYFARRALPYELEIKESKLNGSVEFLPWWNSRGKQMVLRLYEILWNSPGSWSQQNNMDWIKTYHDLKLKLNEIRDQVTGPLGTLGSVSPKARDLFEKVLVEADRIEAEFARHVERLEKTSDKEGTAALTLSPMERIQPVRKFVMVTKENIIKNEIRLNDQIFNAVSFKDDILKANAAMPDHAVRMLSVDNLILNEQNLTYSQEIKWAILQSYLKDELAKMYGGYLTLTGMPELNPHDVIMLLDPVTTMCGPIEVEEVVHSFDQENGFVTIVKPRAFVHVNEFVSGGLMCAAWSMMTNGLNDLFNAEVVTGTATAATLFAAGSAAVFLGAGSMISPVGLAVMGAVAVGGSMVGAKLAKDQLKRNPFFITPLQRYERPWVGGLRGWQVADLSSIFRLRIQELKDEEIAPLLDSFYTLRSILKA